MIEELVAILVLLVGSFVVASSVQQREPASIGRLLMASWGGHVVSAFAVGAVFRYFYGYGDILGYHRRGSLIADLVWGDFWMWAPELFNLLARREHLLETYLHGGDATHTMVGLSALACFLTGNSYWAANLLFAMCAFFAKILLFNACRPFLPRTHHRAALVATTLMPSFVFWSSGIIKESVASVGIGIAAWGLSRIVRGQRSLSALFTVLAGAYLSYLIKPFFLLVTVLAFGGAIAWSRSFENGKLRVRPISVLVTAVLAYAALVGIGRVAPEFAIENLVEATEHQQTNADYGGSSYRVTSGSGFQAQLLASPFALFTGWFRPTLLDVRNPLMLANALETTFFAYLIVVGIRRRGVQGLRDQLVASPFLTFCWLFAAGVGLGTGLASGNLGTLSRYRIPLIPFFAMALFALNDGELRPRWTAVRKRARPRPERRNQVPMASALSVRE